MEYYSAVKNEIVKSKGKHMELELIILSEIIQSQKNKCHVFSLSFESSDICFICNTHRGDKISKVYRIFQGGEIEHSVIQGKNKTGVIKWRVK